MSQGGKKAAAAVVLPPERTLSEDSGSEDEEHDSRSSSRVSSRIKAKAAAAAAADDAGGSSAGGSGTFTIPTAPATGNLWVQQTREGDVAVTLPDYAAGRRTTGGHFGEAADGMRRRTTSAPEEP